MISLWNFYPEKGLRWNFTGRLSSRGTFHCNPWEDHVIRQTFPLVRSLLMEARKIWLPNVSNVKRGRERERGGERARMWELPKLTEALDKTIRMSHSTSHLSANVNRIKERKEEILFVFSCWHFPPIPLCHPTHSICTSKKFISSIAHNGKARSRA